MSKDKETRGRPTTYSTELLVDIVNEYIKTNPSGVVNGNRLAKFAENKGIVGIKARHFTRRKDELYQLTSVQFQIGRGTVYTESEMTDILQHCCSTIPSITKLNVDTLVEQAKKLGYKDVTRHYFTKYPTVANTIKAFESDSAKLLTVDCKNVDLYLQHHSVLNVDEILYLYGKKESFLKVILKDFSARYEALKLDYLKLSHANNKLQDEIESLRKYKSEYASLKEERNMYESKYKKIAEYEKMHDQLYALGKLKEHGVPVVLGEEYVHNLIHNIHASKKHSDNIEDIKDEVYKLINPSDPIDITVQLPMRKNVAKKSATKEQVQELDKFLDTF